MMKTFLRSLLTATCLLVPFQVFRPTLASAQPQGDVFSSQGAYDNFAVGGAHRWYDKHSADAKQKSSHCLSILDEAKAIQETALALDKEARQPGIDSRQATALRKQANEQFALRDKDIRAFIDCFNQANRQKSPRSDQFATSGEPPSPTGGKKQPGEKSSHPSETRRDQGQKQASASIPRTDHRGQETPSDIFSTTGDKTPSDELQTQSPSDEKSIKRTPRPPDGITAKANDSTLKKAIDGCLQEYLPFYDTDWDRLTPESAGVKSSEALQRSFYLSGIAADQVISFVQARYGNESDRELTPDYLIGWLTNCLMDRKVLPRQEPRILYRRYMEGHDPLNINKKRITERFEQFGYGGRLYPSIPPFRDHDSSTTSSSGSLPTTPRANMP